MSYPLDEQIKALAHPLRRDILLWLKTPEQFFSEQDHPLELGVCVGMIFKRCNLSQSTVSAHLASLQQAGLVTCQKVGQWHFFRRNESVIQDFLQQLNHNL